MQQATERRYHAESSPTVVSTAGSEQEGHTMRTQQFARSVLAVSLLAALTTASCQSSDFEPVDPLALAQTTLIEKFAVQNNKPNLMLLVDTSGSMGEPSCSGCSTTRWQELQGAVSSFVSEVGPKARFGLTNYPANNVCAPAGATQVHFDLPASLQDDDLAGLQAQVDGINNTLQNVLRPQGGTPTSESLRFVGGLSSLRDPHRSDYILLLTDGLPNCNPGNPVNGVDDPAACKCTLASGCTATPSSPGAPDYRRLGCLDANTSVQRLAELHEEGIRTIVVGFGALLTGNDAEQTLNAMALAGGFPTGCTGPGPCPRYYPASNQDELRKVLNLIFENLTNPCELRLAPEELPSDPRLVLVKLTDQAGTQTLENGRDYVLDSNSGWLQFGEEACSRIQRSTPEAPITLEVSTIQRK
jgi:Mg-chelatase subunit ChlD